MKNCFFLKKKQITFIKTLIFSNLYFQSVFIQENTSYFRNDSNPIRILIIVIFIFTNRLNFNSGSFNFY